MNHQGPNSLPKKIIFIELDGASWNVITPLIEQGKLPVIRQLINDGTSGPLMSDPPLLSPRLWVTIFSGKNSKKHGIEFFGNSSSMVKCKRIWDIFNDRGHSVGVFGSFATWPPYPVNGFMIPSLFALGTETYPEEYRFLQELTLKERKKGKQGMSSDGNKRSMLYYVNMLKTHGVSFKTLWDTGLDLVEDKIKRSPKDERFWKRALAHLKISTEIFVHLYEKYQPDFATIHIHQCDAFAHRYWKYFEPDKFNDVAPRAVKKYGSVIPKAYIEADRMIGRILQVEGDANVILMSDHGSDAMESLEMAYRINVDKFLDIFRLKDNVIPAHMGLMTFCYFRDEELRKRMLSTFEKVVFSDTGERVFDVMKEESLIGLRLHKDLWGRDINGKSPINLAGFGSSIYADLFSPQKMEVSGNHKKEGILIMAGPGIKRGVKISGASIYDMTPTALALSGFPVAKDMDGRVLNGAIKDEFLGSNPVRYIESYEDGEGEKVADEEKASYDRIKDQLKSLGYL